MTKILVVDDEASIRDLLKFNLEKAGFAVDCVEDGNQAVQRIEDSPPDLLILDLMLPRIDGLEICRFVRSKEKTRFLPVIMLTARVEEVDRIVGLEMGADDYITKPFSPRELVARIKSLLRRSLGAQHPGDNKDAQVVRGELRIDPARYEAFYCGRELELTPKEFQLLLQLAVNQGKVYSREYLLENIWGYEFAGDTRTVDVHIRHLRQKLAKEAGGQDLIETVRGIGYRFRA